MCQIKNIDEMDDTDYFEKKIEMILFFFRKPITFMSIVVKKMKRLDTFKTTYLGKQNKVTSEKDSSSKNSTNFLSSDFHPGDIVMIRSKEQILRTLDINNKLDGCLFMEEMWQYCDTQQKILKKVNYFYDEANFRMCKARNTVLLEGIYCSGKFQRYNTNCDRYCLLFWKEDWLEKIK